MREHRRRAAAVLTAAAATLALALPVPSEASTEPSPAPTLAPRAANTPPVAVPDAAEVVAGATVIVPVLDNDVDDGLGRDPAEPPRLEVTGVSGDDRASATAEAVRFASRTGDSGTVAFQYTVSDGELESTGTVTVEILPATTRAVTLVAPRRIVALRSQRLTGEVSQPNEVDEVRVQRRVGSGRWRLLGRPTPASDGSFAVPVRARRIETWRLRAVATWEPAGRATSTVVKRRVVARLDARLSGPLTAADVPHSYRAGCPVGPARLRKLTVTHFTYGRELRRGSIVVAAGAVPAVRAALSKALGARFGFRQLRPADHFYDGGRRTPTQSDLAAMRADNTSAFNCRTVTGSPYRLSQHSYGNAVDINTVRNPYVTASRVYPPAGRAYLNRRHHRPGMLVAGGAVVSTFRSRGWWWGARWAHPDYQHFSANGG